MTSMTVNGKPMRFLMDPDTPLLWALRDAANLTGTKFGCGEGDCGGDDASDGDDSPKGGPEGDSALARGRHM